MANTTHAIVAATLVSNAVAYNLATLAGADNSTPRLSRACLYFSVQNKDLASIFVQDKANFAGAEVNANEEVLGGDYYRQNSISQCGYDLSEYWVRATNNNAIISISWKVM